MATSKSTTAALAKLKKQKASWNKSRKATDQFGEVNLPDGRYVAQLSRAILAISDKSGQPYARFTFICKGNDDASIDGKRAPVFHSLSKTTNRTLEQNLESFAVTLQRLGYDTADLDLDEVGNILDELNKKKPLVNISVSTGEKGGKFVNLNGLVASDDEEEAEEEEEVEEIEEEEETAEEETEEEESEEEVEEESEEEESEEEEVKEEEEAAEEEEEWEPLKGDVYKYSPKRGVKATDCEVILVNRKAETVSLRDKKTKKVVKGIKWDALGDQVEE